MIDAAVPEIVALALDASPRATGWAIGRPHGKKPAFGTYRLPKWDDAEGERMAAYERWLVGLIADYGVTHVYYEAPFLPKHNNVDAIRPHFYVLGLINLVATRLKLDVAEVRIDDWRKWAYGFCRLAGLKDELARKEWKRLAMAQCAKDGLLAETDDAAEAILILDYGLSDADYSHRRTSSIRQRRQELNVWKGERQ